MDSTAPNEHEPGSDEGRAPSDINNDFLAPKSPVTAALGEMLRTKREAADISIRGMSQRLDVVINTIRKWESGATCPRSEDLLKIAGILKIEPAELLAIDPHLLTPEA